MKRKVRLDVLLVERGLAESREQARRLILSGKVTGPSSKLDKPGVAVDPELSISVSEPEHPYVSRGGLKLAGALDGWKIDPAGWTCADFGSSTGGFTDCLLQRGAERIFAFDVGRGQLHWKLRQDSRVEVREGVNVRYITLDDLPGPVDLVVIDLAFISLVKVMASVRAVLKPEGLVVALVKPQFEVGKGKVGKKGIVRRWEDRLEVLQGHLSLVAEHNLAVLGLMRSPIAGMEGNIEYLSLLVPVDGEAKWREQLGQAVAMDETVLRQLAEGESEATDGGNSDS